MIVALLVVIVLILLFGAGVVKGALVNVASVGCAGLLVLAAFLWLGSFFEENGSKYIIWGILGILVLLALGLARDSDQSAAMNTVDPQLRQRPLPTEPNTKPHASSNADSRDRVWGWFAQDISLRFGTEAREKAHQLYEANDVIGLDLLCREETERLDG